MSWYDEPWNNGQDYFSEDPPNVSEILFRNTRQDERALQLFTDYMFDDDELAYRELVDYMWDQYGIDFENAFVWEDFRKWYEEHYGKTKH